MADITLVLGGVRSGKSNLALSIAKKSGKKTAFIATNMFKDKEMKNRIKLHRLLRPKNWVTIEEGYNLEKSLLKADCSCKNILIDCIGIYISNLMHKRKSDEEIVENIESFIKKAFKSKFKSIYIVSNEVGSGIVPVSKLGRRFRDILGLVNQIIAKNSNKVYFTIAGIPLEIKDGKWQKIDNRKKIKDK